MNQENIYTSGAYFERNPSWHEEDSPWKARQISKILKRNDLRPTTVGEVGCGAGEILNCLAAEYGDRVSFSGYEVSPQAFALCSRKEKPHLRFFLKDLLQDPETHLDVLLAIDVFEHVEDYFGFLRQLKTRATHKIFHIPLDLSVQSVFRSHKLMDTRQRVGHIHYFTKDTAIATLKDTGYEIVDHFYTSTALDLPNQSWKSRLMKVPRSLLFSMNKDSAARLLGGFSLLVLAK